MNDKHTPRTAISIAAVALCGLLGAAPGFARDEHPTHVLLVSVDGMHEADLTHYIETHPGSTFAKLARHGVEYTHASASKPSDSFPGLLFFAPGGSPLSHGVFYDDS